MQTIGKRFLSLLFAVVLVLSCTINIFATEVSDASHAFSENDVMPLADQYIVGMHVGTTRQSEINGNFQIVSGLKKASMSVDINVDAPCILFVYLYDANGKILGGSSLKITRAGSFTMIPSPSTLGAGSYSYGFSFDQPGIEYQLYVKATI